MVGGCLLALPVAWVLKLIVVGMGEKEIPMHSSGVSMADYDATRRSVGRKKFVPDPFEARSPYTVVGSVIVCNECRKATSKVNGNPPPSCPNCDEPFEDLPVARKVKKQLAAARQHEDEDLVDPKRV